jgi:hypothetical protein
MSKKQAFVIVPADTTHRCEQESMQPEPEPEQGP